MYFMFLYNMFKANVPAQNSNHQNSLCTVYIQMVLNRNIFKDWCDKKNNLNNEIVNF